MSPALGSAEPTPLMLQTSKVQAAVKLATGAVLPAGAVTVTFTSLGTGCTWS